GRRNAAEHERRKHAGYRRQADADSEADGGHAMDVDAGRDRLLAIVHHGAREIAEPGTIQICVDEEDGAAARDAAHDPGRRKGLAEQLDWAVLDLVPGEE